MEGRPVIIGITCDLVESPRGLRAQSALPYADSVFRAAESLSIRVSPVLLPPTPALAESHLAACDAFIFTGGDDPRMEPFGEPTHPAATPMHPQRQEYEMRLLKLLRTRRPEAPVLGICLGMQLMCLDAGGKLDQHLPESLATAARHKNSEHVVVAVGRGPLELSGGLVASNHHQAVMEPGPSMTVLARSDDGVIEAVADRARPYFVGVQWHPERTAGPGLSILPFAGLIRAVRTTKGTDASDQ